MTAHNSVSGYKFPGRLGHPDTDLGHDPRLNPKLLKAAIALVLDKNAPPSTLTAASSLEELAESAEMADTGSVQLFEHGLQTDLPGDENEPNVEQTTKTITGEDGHEIKLYVFRKSSTSGKILPCVVYFHGGGMVIIPTWNKTTVRWCKSLALGDVVVVMPDFRNAWTKEGHNPFPVGLNDCAAAVKYIANHTSEFGIAKIITHGESGGGNLALATALKAKKEGWIGAIDGVYACAPYISNLYGASRERKIKELPSLVENTGYFIEISGSNTLAAYYTYEEENKTNPLAWPYHATIEDLRGLPPHHLAMDELDPLRDEGIAYYRKLAEAGVPAVGTVTLGGVHATAAVFHQALPEVHNSTIQSIAAFARNL